MKGKCECTLGNQFTPLEMASYQGHVGVVDLLTRCPSSKIGFDRVAAVRWENASRGTKFLTELSLAARAGHIGVVCLLVNRGADSRLPHNLPCRHYQRRTPDLTPCFAGLPNTPRKHKRARDSETGEKQQEAKSSAEPLVEAGVDLTVPLKPGRTDQLTGEEHEVEMMKAY
ncbi:hypothetical protein BDZ88DRAFT_417150 [Geranomyces variabilis]|nr:hypothetical protein BDZ88DRAFT_417150 [Geranomyces variabilis]